MAEKIEGLSIELDLDHLSVDRGLKGLKDNLRTVNSEMKHNMSAFDRSDRSVGKYETRLTGLNKKLEVQRRATAEAKAEYEKMVSEYGHGSKEAEKAAREYNNQAASLNNLERYIGRTTEELEQLKREQKIANSNWTKMGKVLENSGDKVQKFGQGMSDVGSTLNRRVTVPLAAVGGAAVKVGSDFEAGMSKVGAVSGASAEEMDRLETKAREMGKTTVFSAKETSDAFYYMSLAGWDASEMMDGISGVMDLAAASGEDLALVSDIVTDGLTAFGESAEESGRMADVLAAASSNANTDVAGLGQAFSYVAPVAGALGYTMEDTSKAIGLMANSGIKSTKAGTALRKMMNSLAKPTSKAQELMDKYGISLTDSEGNMKSFDDVMLDLRRGLGNLSEEQQAQAAATIFGQEAMSGALAIVNASEDDYKKLTDSIEGSEGAASEMAETMQDNLQGSLKELKSMMEDLFIEMYQNLKPTLESVVDGAKDLTEWFANLSPKTQENIVKFGLLAAAAGPVLTVTGKMTTGFGGLMKGAGKLSKAIGVSSSVGLLGSLGSLGPLAIGGIAVAGIVGVGVAIKNLMDDSEELQEVNLDVAQSLTDQATELENSAATFDKLSEKAKISNDELAKLNDLNIRISESSNPGEIKELQKQYDQLAKNSGLSKDELEELFGANKNIIEQSPDVEKSISNQGNEFAKNTDAVNEYIQSLYEMSRQELSDEMVIAEENKRKILKDNKQIKEEIAELDKRSNDLRELEAMSEEERNKALLDWHTEIKQQMALHKGDQEKFNELKKEEEIILGYINEGIGQGLEEIKKQRDALNEKVAKNDEELQKINALDQEMANIILKQAGINEEGEKGLETLDKKLAKNQEELAELDKQLEKNGKLTQEEQKKYDKLVESNGKLKEAKQYLNDEIGLYKDINSLANGKLDRLDKEQKKKIESLAKSVDLKNTEKDIVKELDKKNGKLTEERKKLEENRKKQGANKKEIDEQISSLDTKISKNAEVKKQLLEELGVWDNLDSSVQEGINKEIRKGQAVDETKGKLKNQGRSIDDNNRKTDIGIGKERERSAEAGKDVDKAVDVSDYGTVANLNKRATQKKNKRINVGDYGTIAKLNRSATQAKSKRVNLTDGGSLARLNTRITSPITKTVNLVAKGASTIKNWFADGTPKSGHPGGHAVLGDGKGSNAGSELVTLPSGRSFLSAATPTLYPNLPKGTNVISAKETKTVMKSIPKYAQGTNDWSDLFFNERLINSEFMRLLSLNSRDDKSKINLSNQASNDDLKEIIQVMKEFIQVASKSKEIHQENHYHGNAPLSPSESARKNKQMLRQAAIEW